MTAGAILLGFGLLFLTGTALLAFFWAARDGQFANLNDGAASIFDDEEPVGNKTDFFPSDSSQ